MNPPSFRFRAVLVCECGDVLLAGPWSTGDPMPVGEAFMGQPWTPETFVHTAQPGHAAEMTFEVDVPDDIPAPLRI